MRATDLLKRFLRDTSGTNVVEFAILATPFVLLLVFVAQISIFYLAQAALDTGVIRTAESLKTAFYTSTVTTFPNAATLKSRVQSYSGGIVSTAGTIAVEIRPLTALTSATVAVVDGTNNYGSANSVLAVRATASVPSFVPGISSWVARSSALVRRQAQ